MFLHVLYFSSLLTDSTNNLKSIICYKTTGFRGTITESPDEISVLQPVTTTVTAQSVFTVGEDDDDLSQEGMERDDNGREAAETEELLPRQQLITEQPGSLSICIGGMHLSIDYAIVLKGCISQYITLCIGGMHLSIHYTLCWRDASLNTLCYCIGGMHLIHYAIVLEGCISQYIRLCMGEMHLSIHLDYMMY